MQILNTHEAKTKLSAVLQTIEETGEPFLICRNGKAIAELVPYRKKDRLSPHPTLSQIRMDYDPTEDLTKSEWGEVE
jgi:antitoxin (DNA-binding transcriptional repressor) of toxin-antitoxin stability system